uniref:Chromosome 15 open reading frame 39 n=1 Tax=Pelusios castaneus TaxID=367368 RepID=A0A8C8R4U1_9SAUR
MMAGKRHLESLDGVTYSKLSRLEAEPNSVLAAGLCKSRPLPNHGSENHFSYKGSYFAYPLQNHRGTESLTHWSPATSYMQYPGNAVGQHLRTDGALMNCLLYGREAESLGARPQDSGADKGKDSMVRDLLIVQKWANHMGQQDPLQQVQGHAFSVQKPVLLNKAVAQAPTGCATLAMPKPVYRSPVCYVDPRASMSLQTQMESMQKRPLEVEWTLPTPVSSGHHSHAKDQHCATAVHKRAHHPDPSFLQSHQSAAVPMKESVATSVGFPPYHAAFEKYRAQQSTFMLEANYPAMYNLQKRVAEIHGSSSSQHTWSKLQPSAASPLVHSQTAAYRDGSPACYQLSHYPLTSHKQPLFYQEVPHAEEQTGALLTMPASGGYKGISFPGSGEPQPFSSAYLRQHSPRGYYPSPLESYMYSTAGPIPGTPPTLKPGIPSREPALEQNSSCKVGYPQQSSSYAFTPSDVALYNDSLANAEAGRDSSTVAAFQGTSSVRESPRSKQVASQHNAFQPICDLGGLPCSSERLTDALPKRETGCGVGLGQREQRSMCGKGQSQVERRSPLSMEEPTPRNTRSHEAPLGATIVITDSPVSYQHHYRKGEAPKAKDFAEGCVSSPLTLLSEERPKSLKNAEDSPPSSPPMPVINNVFSLAPYRDYIEGSKESAKIPVSKGHQGDDSHFKNAGTSLGNGDSTSVSELPSAKDSSKKPVVLPTRKEATQVLKAEIGMSGNCREPQQEGSCSNKTRKSYKPTILPRSLPVGSEPASQNGSICSPAAPGNGELARDNVVLDLSLKKELMKASPLNQARQTEVTPKGESTEEDRKKEGPLKKQRVFERSKTQTLPLLIEDSSGDKSNFQSSAAFMFKKYKLLKSVPARAMPPVHVNGPLVAVTKDPPAAPAQANGPPAAPAQANGPPAAPAQANGPPAAPAQANGPPAAPAQANGPLAAAMQGLPAALQANGPPLGTMQDPPAPAQANCPPAATTQPSPQPLQMTCLYLKLPDISQSLPPSAPEASPALGEANVSLPSNCESPAQQTSASQYFTALHMSLCNMISCSVSETSLELLKDWLKKAELDGEQKERPKSPPQHKNGSRILEAQKPSKGKQIWLGFRDVSVLLSKLLSQLETFMFTRKCPFPHVVRAGAIFIPIHVVKEKLFPKLSGVSVDHVLQEHKVELRPTTLSEEKLLRDLELKCCTSRMLKLLALKQLPDVYPDLLNLHWQDCVKQHLGEHGAGTLKDEGKALTVDYVKKKATGGLMGAETEMPVSLLKGKHRKGKFLILSKWGSSQEEAATMEPEKTQPLNEKPQGSCSPPNGGDTLLMDERTSPQVDAGSLDSKSNGLPLCSGAKRGLFQCPKSCRTLELKLTRKTSRKTRSTSRVLHLRNSMVRIKFQRVTRRAQRTIHGARGRCPASRRGCSLLNKTLRHKAESPTSPSRYPELVGKRIRHLYEENDKTEAWYQGVVLRIHKPHKNPLRSVYEVKYDSEPERQYYLEILQDYKKGWLEVDE